MKIHWIIKRALIKKWPKLNFLWLYFDFHSTSIDFKNRPHLDPLLSERVKATRSGNKNTNSLNSSGYFFESFKPGTCPLTLWTRTRFLDGFSLIFMFVSKINLKLVTKLSRFILDYLKVIQTSVILKTRFLHLKFWASWQVS